MLEESLQKKEKETHFEILLYSLEGVNTHKWRWGMRRRGGGGGGGEDGDSAG